MHSPRLRTPKRSRGWYHVNTLYFILRVSIGIIMTKQFLLASLFNRENYHEGKMSQKNSKTLHIKHVLKIYSLDGATPFISLFLLFLLKNQLFLQIYIHF